jgi:nucleoside-diphosphate-sugar epimerase
LQNEVHYVVHCAATVDFRERLDNAVKKNVLGTLQLFECAKTFHNLKGFVHVSTAYVNSDRQGFHAEELPQLSFDPEETVQLILQMDQKELEKATPKLIGNYPNTYTYTKAIAERLLEKRRYSACI